MPARSLPTWLLLPLILGGCSSGIIMRHQDGREVDCGG
jgi:hypothetical protein